MKTLTNQLRAILAAVIMLITSLPALAYNFVDNGFYYNVIDETAKTVKVTYGDNKYSGSITIPPSVSHNDISYSVTSIGYGAFRGCTGLTSIIIPNSVTSIGGAFYGCNSLTSIVVAKGNSKYDSRDNCNAIIETKTNRLIAGCKNTTIPNSVTEIGKSAFVGCSGLTSIIIPNSVTEIGGWAFKGCSGLTSITIPNSVTSIGDGAFYCCDGLTSITIPNSVTEIGESAFSGCDGLTSIVVAKGNSKYDSRDNCNAIIETETNRLIVGCKNTTIPNSVTIIGNYAFYECDGLTSIMIPNSVTEIGNYAFYGCSDLTSISIPNSVTEIGESAFDFCDGLTSITIPNSVTEIGESAFSGCDGLTSIVVAKGNSKYDSRDNCNAIIETETNRLIAGCKNTTIPNSVTSIGERAFFGCDGLTSITIPNSVTKIGNWAFAFCDGLTAITIPNSVTSIGNYAFSRCSGLTSITIPNSVTSIGNYAFSGCYGLKTIIIQNPDVVIGYNPIPEGVEVIIEK